MSVDIYYYFLEMYMLQKSKSPRIKELIEIFQLRESESIAHRKAIKFLEHPNYNDENFQQIIRGTTFIKI